MSGSIKHSPTQEVHQGHKGQTTACGFDTRMNPGDWWSTSEKVTCCKCIEEAGRRMKAVGGPGGAFSSAGLVHGRECGHCHLRAGVNEHDPCISELPGSVMNACCGHGREEEAYIQYHQGAQYVPGVKTNSVAATLALVLMRVSHPRAGRAGSDLAATIENVHVNEGGKP